MKTDRQQLLDRLSLLKPALKAGGLIPELSHVWFREGAAFAYDGASLGISVKVDTEMECGLPGPVLLGLLGTSGLADVTLEPDDSGSHVTVKMGRSRTKLAALDSSRDVWPFPQSTGKADDSLGITDEFLKALGRVLVAEPRLVTRVEHQGVMLYRDKGSKKGCVSLSLCATDGATLAGVTLDVDGIVGDPLMLPRAFAEQVTKNCRAGDVMELRGDHLVVESDGLVIYSQTVDVSEAQDLKALIDGVVDGHPEPVPVPHGLAIALERATILEGKDEAVVEVQVEGDDMRVRGSYRYGNLDELMKVGDHPEASGKFTALHVRRGLSGAKTLSLAESALVLYGDREGDVYCAAPRRSD